MGSPKPPPKTSGRGPQGPPTRGQLEVIRPLASGSQVLLLEAWDHASRREVAIRLLRPEAKKDPAMVEEFWRQARYQARIHHAHIVTVHSIDESAGWVVTEYCPTSLATKRVAKGVDSVRLRSILVDALKGLDHLHQQGHVHGEIQPAAIMINKEGVVKLDRPCGREAIAELARRGGSEKYAAPEMLDEAKFGAVGPPADIYALGVMALELLAGERFADFFTKFDLDVNDPGPGWLRWHMSAGASLPPIAEILPDTSPLLASAIDRMLVKDVTHRFATASDVLNALEQNQMQPAANSEHLTAIAPSTSDIIAPVRSYEPSPSQGVAKRQQIAKPSPQSGESSKLKSWAENITDEKNSNRLAAIMVLASAFIAGLALVGGGAAEPSVAFAPESQPAPVPRLDSDESNEVPIPVPPVVPAPQPPAEPISQQNKNADLPASGDVVEPPQPPMPGRVVVTVRPSAGSIRLTDQSGRGRISASLPPGTYEIEASKWDYYSERRTVVVKSGGSSRISIQLRSRPVNVPYEPILYVSHERAAKADEHIEQLLTNNFKGDSHDAPLALLERRLLHTEDPVNAMDPRLAHAVALVALERPRGMQRAQPWFDRAARNAPICYSWPQKGLIKCALSSGAYEEALQLTDALVFSTSQFARTHRSDRRAEHFANDTAVFAGRVLGLVESVSHRADTTSLASRSIEQQVGSELGALVQSTKRATIARYRETVEQMARPDAQLVQEFLGNTTGRERHLLLKSVGQRCVNNSPYKVVFPNFPVDVDRSASRLLGDLVSQVSGKPILRVVE